ncbi:hypothetical protein KP509_12G027700 [Ceratopteris richardii]|uniref:L-2-amino-thiazoline-4-carboxylic acid hydrolase n=1 Tax=Ceratopteris richardii TaxID=49495 RepID=A0A8T2THI6_CERRI|nr:hypothetical protein KP509_12G027700 [Ceratopteris richardii]
MWKRMLGAVAKRTEALQYRTYIDSLLKNLGEHHQVIGHESAIKNRIHEVFEESMKKHQDLIADSRARAHLQVACLVEGSYKALLPWFRNDQDKVIELIRKPLGESAAGLLGVSQKIALFLSFNKFSFMSRSLKYMDADFGKSFSVEHHIMPSSHRASVKRCIYNSVFKADGVPELTPIFCALDRMWFDQVHPKKHGVTFSRSSTLAQGATSCDFVVSKADVRDDAEASITN